MKEVRQSESGIKKIHFKNNMVRSPFYVYLKINGIENKGMVTMRFYQREYLYTPASILRIWFLFHRSSFYTSDLSFSKNPFMNFLHSPVVDSFAFKTVGFSIFRQFCRGYFFFFSSRLITPYVFDLSHFYYPLHKSIKEMIFKFGEQGKYYEHIIFIDKVSTLLPGQYRFAIFLNNILTYEGYLNIFPRK